MVSGFWWYVLFALVGTAVVWKGSDMLERSSKRLSLYFGLPPVVQGAIVVAVGSSFPELSSTVVSTYVHGAFDLGVSAIVGSAIFNLLVIPALSGIFADGVEADRSIVYKEAQFYMVAVAVLLITFALAVIYHPVANTRLHGTVTWQLALIPIAFYGVYLFTQYQDTQDYDAAAPPNGISPLREVVMLLASLALIAVAVEGLVTAALGFGDLFGTPDFIWGLTVVAAGTSLPDTLVSVRAATDNEGVTSIANVLGSNVFDLLIAVPAGVMVAGTAEIDFSVAVPLMGFLTLATVIVFAFLRTELSLSKNESWGLLAVYCLFLVWMLLETVGVTHVVPGA
ncbi:sodium/calcium exchanger membrane region [Haladaptatus paucihalophilus DX253]|uniref:Cation:H+ antiporter n=1 Tax=Haladaptatus paucihalophilus DX253 TaxID=797209 RepID=E7QQD4_HALPU|nr:sodium:calcium antiporter [Haladaptatus paucihalophilus]EFW93198.1 sodium/calcium exchanger membrane region [Haladaptatus paucihalophilus DX253]SHK47679.1 cation:H+ antiporter [Haladaptatus paucihalophilus DX253]